MHLEQCLAYISAIYDITKDSWCLCITLYKYYWACSFHILNISLLCLYLVLCPSLLIWFQFVFNLVILLLGQLCPEILVPTGLWGTDYPLGPEYYTVDFLLSWFSHPSFFDSTFHCYLSTVVTCHLPHSTCLKNRPGNGFNVSVETILPRAKSRHWFIPILISHGATFANSNYYLGMKCSLRDFWFFFEGFHLIVCSDDSSTARYFLLFLPFTLASSE